MKRNGAARGNRRDRTTRRRGGPAITTTSTGVTPIRPFRPLKWRGGPERPARSPRSRMPEPDIRTKGPREYDTIFAERGVAAESREEYQTPTSSPQPPVHAAPCHASSCRPRGPMTRRRARDPVLTYRKKGLICRPMSFHHAHRGDPLVLDFPEETLQPAAERPVRCTTSS